MDADNSDQEMVVVGHIAGAYGVRGWVRIYSETSPIDHILQYQPWYLEAARAGNRGGHSATPRWQATRLLQVRRQGKGLVAQIAACDDRDRAAELRGTRIAVSAAQLPQLDDGEYYWRDMVGLEVVNQQAVVLGKVSGLMETGNNDVLVVNGERERLIPYLPGSSVVKVDLAAGRILVDWDQDF